MSSRLTHHLQRLYRLPGDLGSPSDSSLHLVGADGSVRCMVLGLGQPADWGALAAVWRGVQADLEWPAPAIAVNGVDAFELWFALAEPVPVDQAADMLQGLCRRYLADVKPQRLRLRPSPDAGFPQPFSTQATQLIPALQGDSGNWSAFVAPDLAAVFGDDPVLDLPPGDDAQADLLSRLTCIRPAAFQAALLSLKRVDSHEALGLQAPAMDAGPWEGPKNSLCEDPRRFLLAVMNDAAVSLALRIEAAKALLTADGVEPR